MRPFWRRRRTHLIETLLRAYRPEPDPGFISSILERITPERRAATLLPRLGGRLALAGALSALALVAATAAAGGVGQASHGVQGIVTSSAHTVGIGHSSPSGGSVTTNGGTTAGKDDEHKGGDDGDDDDDDHHRCHKRHDGHCHEYWKHICHHTDSKTNPWVELTVSPQGAEEHLKNHKYDMWAPDWGCPKKDDDHNKGH